MTNERYVFRTYAPGDDVPTSIKHKGQSFVFDMARMSKRIKGGVSARFVRR